MLALDWVRIWAGPEHHPPADRWLLSGAVRQRAIHLLHWESPNGSLSSEGATGFWCYVCVPWSKGLGSSCLVTVNHVHPHLLLGLHPWGSTVQSVPKKCVKISCLWIFSLWVYTLSMTFYALNGVMRENG